VTLFDWAKFRRTKGAIKLHLLLDHDGYLPSFAVVTEGKQSELKVARSLEFEPGTILVIDRGYIDYDWFASLTRQAVWFVTRMKENAAYKVKAEFVEVLAEFLETAPLRSRLGNGALILNGLPSRARQQADPSVPTLMRQFSWS